jgi:PAS domain S-box-containing protein
MQTLTQLRPLHLAKMAGLALVYFAAAKVGLLTAFRAPQVSPFWPPSGIALAALVLLGRDLWPGVALGAFFANLTAANETAAVAFGITVGNTLEAVAGAWLLRRAGFHSSLSRLRDVLALLTLGAVFSTAISATLGVAALCAGGVRSWSEYSGLWFVWWLGDALGDLVVAPVLLTWAAGLRRRWKLSRILEAGAMVGGLLAVSQVVFAGQFPRVISNHALEYAAFPFVIWAGIRFGPRETSLVTLAASVLAILGTVRGQGPFVRGSPHESLMMLQTFMLVVAVTALVVAAAIAERNTAERLRAAGYAITRVLAESSGPEEAEPRILAAFGEKLEWDLGVLWLLDPIRKVLRFGEVWRASGSGSPDLEEGFRKQSYLPEAGLAGRIRASGEPDWIPRGPLPCEPALEARDGIKMCSSFGFPVTLGGEVAAVYQFFSRHPRPPDQHLLKMAPAVGSQIGQFIERRRAEDSLRESHVLLRAVAEGTSEAVFVKDAGGRYLMINSAGASFMGKSVEEVLGKDDLALFAPETAREIMEADRRIMASGEIRTLEEGTRVGNAARTFLTTKGPYRDDRGRILGIIGIAHDITERKAAEDERARLLSLEQASRAAAEDAQRRSAFLAEASSLLASSLDYQATLQSLAGLVVPHLADFCSVRALGEDGSIRWLGVAHVDPAKVKLAEELYHRYSARPEDPHGVWKVLKTGEAEVRTEITAEELSAVARDEEHLRLLRELDPRSLMIVPLTAHGRVLGAISFIRSGSDRRYSQADLELAQELARRSALAIDHARMYRESNEANRFKDEFLAMLAHELRNPLAPVLNAAQLIGLTSGGSTELSWAAGVIKRQVQHMSRLLDDLLDVSRITRGRIELRKVQVDLAEVVERAVENTRSRFEERGHRLSISQPAQPLWLEADPIRLEQVLVNLLNNAVKYTSPSGSIWLRTRAEGTQVVLELQDSGKGISPEMIPRIFDLFVQSDRSLDRTQGGLGIGLTVVQSLVQLHGGRVEAESDGPGKGSTFRVRLPGSSSLLEPAVKVREEPIQRGRSLKVLVVDDIPDVAETMALLLKMLGHDVRVVHDGPSALETARIYQPDAVLLDIGLPGMDGYQVAERLRKQEGGGKTLLVAVSGYGQENDRQRSRQAGFDQHLLKPVELEVLEKVLLDLTCRPSKGGSGRL